MTIQVKPVYRKPEEGQGQPGRVLDKDDTQRLLIKARSSVLHMEAGYTTDNLLLSLTVECLAMREETIYVPPGAAPARRRKRADNAGVAQVRYTPGSTLSGNVEPTCLDRTRQACPRASQSCRSTRPGCEQPAHLLAPWAGPPAAPRTSWCSSLPGCIGSPALAGRQHRRSAGARHPGSTLSGNVEPTRLDRTRQACPRASQSCRSTRPGANSQRTCWLHGRVLLLHRGRAGARPSRGCTGSPT